MDMAKAEETCSAKHKVNIKDADDAKLNFTKASADVKCFVQCLGIELNLFDKKKGIFNETNILKTLTIFKPEKLKEVLGKCIESIGPALTLTKSDDCEPTAKMVTCINDLMNTEGGSDGEGKDVDGKKDDGHKDVDKKKGRRNMSFG